MSGGGSPRPRRLDRRGAGCENALICEAPRPRGHAPRPRAGRGDARDRGDADRGERGRPRLARPGARLRDRVVAGAGQRRRGAGRVPARGGRRGRRRGAGPGRRACRACRPAAGAWCSACATTPASARPRTAPCGPSDVKASVERLFLIRSPGRALYRGIRGARAFEAAGEGGIAGIVARDGAGEVEFRLARSDPSFVRVLALPFGFALPRGTPAVRPGRRRRRLGGALPRRRLRPRRPHRAASATPATSPARRARPRAPSASASSSACPRTRRCAARPPARSTSSRRARPPTRPPTRPPRRPRCAATSSARPTTSS